MADDGSAQTKTTWPIPRFYFTVKWDNQEVACQEVSGLDAETEVMEYRAGNSPVFAKVKMPGLLKYTNVTMKKAVFAKDNTLFDWFKENKMNIIKRKAVTITLMDENKGTAMAWKLKNAFPVKIQGTDLKSEGNEIAVETIEIAHEGFEIEAS